MRLILLIIYSLFILTLSCKNENVRKFRTIKKEDVVIKGFMINDTIFDDTIYYYNYNNTLIAKDYYKNGKQEGLSIDYYQNENARTITTYSDGLKNGFTFYYDSLGKCFYKNYYYYNLVVGPVIYFDKNEYPKRFFFVSLENETLMDIDYRAWHGIKNIVSKCINFKANTQRSDSTKQLTLLLYLFNPTKFSFEYSIVKKKKNSEDDFTKIFDIKESLPFVNIVLPILPDDEQYSVGLSVYDSILNKKTIIYKDF